MTFAFRLASGCCVAAAVCAPSTICALLDSVMLAVVPVTVMSFATDASVVEVLLAALASMPDKAASTSP